MCCRTHQTSILLVQQLVPSCQGIQVLLFDELFHFLVGLADAIVKVSTPEHVIMRVQQATLKDKEEVVMHASCATGVLNVIC